MDKTDAKNLQAHSMFKGLGLTEEEVLIYHALLAESEYASIRSIASITKLNRGAVYEAIKHLVDKGLVSFNRKGERRYYFAERPVRIYDLIEQKKQELNHIETKARSLVPRLQAILKRQDGQPLVRFYEHDEGIHAILHDVLSTTAATESKEYYAYSHLAIRPYLYRNFPNYTKQRIKLGVSAKIIKIGRGEGINGLDEIRWFIGPETSHASCYTLIYGNKVAMISVSEDGTPYGVVIEEEGVALMQKLLFNRLWDNLPHKPKP